MMNPYEVLGVSRDADMDTIKKAYRSLSRKYHPDANINNPNKEEAEEKFKQIQQAYKQIVDEREHGAYGAGYGNAYGYGQSSYNSSQQDMELQAAATYINNRMFQQALNTLNQMSSRNGMWYYLHAVANASLGNNVNATEDIKMAVELEPNNPQFRMLYQQLTGMSGWYNQMGGNYGYRECDASSMSRCCTTCCAVNMCLTCCGGGAVYPCCCGC